MDLIKIKKSEGHRHGIKKRRASYIDLKINFKREMYFFPSDELNITLNDDALSERLGASGTINLIFGQTINPHPGDSLRIKLEISSAIAEIGIERQGE
jgi:hypothetical protein